MPVVTSCPTIDFSWKIVEDCFAYFRKTANMEFCLAPGG